VHRMIRSVLSRPGSEQGAVLVMVALWLPLVILIASLAMDAGNWFVHGRHLQLQADAGALAGAQNFVGPAPSSGLCSGGKTDADVLADVNHYAGIDTGGPNPPLNQQIGVNGAVKLALNQKLYPDQPTNPAPDDTNTGLPCETGQVDAKLADENVPWFFKATGLVKFINAHARVQLMRETEKDNLFPIAVPEFNPKQVVACFINEADGSLLPGGTVSLDKGAASGGVRTWMNNLPAGVNANTSQVGVRVGVSNADSTAAAPSCSSSSFKYYDTGAQTGLTFVQGWVTSGTQNIRQVALNGTSCPDAYGVTNAYFADPTNCTFTIDSYFDITGANSQTAADNLLVSATYNGQTKPNNGTKPTFVASGASGHLHWTSPSFNDTTGAHKITITVNQKKNTTSPTNCSSNKDCTLATFSNVQATYGLDATNPIPVQGIRVINADDPGAPTITNSLIQGTHQLQVRVGVKGNLQDLFASGQQTSLRVAIQDPTTSKTQSLDCNNGATNLRLQIANGCDQAFAINTDPNGACPLNFTSLPVWVCVPLSEGNKTGQLAQGLQDRILAGSSSCSPQQSSQWPNFSSTDPRLVPVVVTSDGAFTGSNNNKAVPVLDFAYFYIIGWTAGNGNGQQDPCAGDTLPTTQDSIEGYFVKYTDPPTGNGTEICDPTAFEPCVPQLTQ
jgi:hypothetical protein